MIGRSSDRSPPSAGEPLAMVRPYVATQVGASVRSRGDRPIVGRISSCSAS